MVKKLVQQILKEKADVGGIRQVYMVACGGSLGAYYPAKSFLECSAKELKVGCYNSNEFVHQPPAALGPNSVVIVTSHKGNTPETIEAARMCQELGVTVIGYTWIKDSPLVSHCDHVLSYTFGPKKDIENEKPVAILKLVVEILQQTEGYAHFDKFQKACQTINSIVYHAMEQVRPRAAQFAQNYKDDSFIYTMGSGAGFGAAYMESICIFMEMQWINSASLHSGEFFHGPFEITDRTVPFVLQISEGKTRALDERALAFLQKYASRYEILDAKELGLSIIDKDVVDFFNHSLFNNVYSVYNEALAAARQHPLSVRRYMWQVEY